MQFLPFLTDVATRFLYEPEIDALLADASLRDSMGARRRAIDLVRIAGEWLDASRVDPSALRVKADRLERIVHDHNWQTRQKWLARIQDADFGKALGKVMRRPSVIPLPGFVMRLMFGEVATVVLDGQRVLPEKLQALGFSFKFPTAETAFRDLLGK